MLVFLETSGLLSLYIKVKSLENSWPDNDSLDLVVITVASVLLTYIFPLLIDHTGTKARSIQNLQCNLVPNTAVRWLEAVSLPTCSCRDGEQRFADSKLGSCLALLHLELGSSLLKEFPRNSFFALNFRMLCHSAWPWSQLCWLFYMHFQGLACPQLIVKTSCPCWVCLSLNSALLGGTKKSNVCAGYTATVKQF